MEIKSNKIAIIGLGYVGLPLAVAFAHKYKVIGFDISTKRVDELKSAQDNTLEINSELLNTVLDNQNINVKGLTITSNPELLSNCDIYIITVPTPTDKFNKPVLTPLVKASEIVAPFLKKGNIVIG